MRKVPALVVGGGPAGLMAAEMLAQAGHRVLLAETRPTLGRKLLMAGKSGLNLTRAEPGGAFLAAYGEAAPWLAPAIGAFGPEAVQDWARGLGIELFTGSTGRVFPVGMKASPLLRAWRARLHGLGVEVAARWRWAGWEDGSSVFETPEGTQRVCAQVTVLALGGASWGRLGSDGSWAGTLGRDGVEVTPFAPANAGLSIAWSAHMAPLMGRPVKGAAFRCGPLVSRGEAVISQRGMEGGGIYSVSKAVREGHALTVDLLPDVEEAQAAARLARPRGKASLANHLRKALKLDPVQIALLNEFARPLPGGPAALAALIKALPLRHSGLRPMDEAISTAGGVAQSALDARLMLKTRPGVFCAGEMLDWEAPTGGYLLTACLATGRAAGQGAAARLAAAR